MLYLLESFYGARAHHTYRKLETNAEAEADSRLPSRILLILIGIACGEEFGPEIHLPKIGQFRLKLTFSVHQKRHKASPAGVIARAMAVIQYQSFEHG